MTKSVVHLLRHGEVYNPQKVLYGRLPGFRLSDLGQAQATLSAQWLAERDIGYLVSSPLERARQTAAPLAELTGLQVAIDERLIEADNALQGRRLAGGENLRALFTTPSDWKLFRNPLRPSWGEPYLQVAQRVLAAAHSAAAKAGGHEAVCVTHQLPVVAARRHAEGLRLAHDPRRRQCSLASVTSITFIDDVIVRVDYAEPAAVLPAGVGTGA